VSKRFEGDLVKVTDAHRKSCRRILEAALEVLHMRPELAEKVRAFLVDHLFLSRWAHSQIWSFACSLKNPEERRFFELVHGAVKARIEQFHREARASNRQKLARGFCELVRTADPEAIWRRYSGAFLVGDESTVRRNYEAAVRFAEARLESWDFRRSPPLGDPLGGFRMFIEHAVLDGGDNVLALICPARYEDVSGSQLGRTPSWFSEWLSAAVAVGGICPDWAPDLLMFGDPSFSELYRGVSRYRFRQKKLLATVFVGSDEFIF
jgi:hypothetical protein